ncbi:hypothetical protein AB205_0019190 [Aquarana catesbeiana]|uniref:Uncharacterized protein n=1 Tax=Aquarana catesbeiana TaxID=8400 RepID=A0A2G9NB74_AQUCT|nr:hypothetical protein AB205_0019190 [Aquarana catesbeiana]
MKMCFVFNCCSEGIFILSSKFLWPKNDNCPQLITNVSYYLKKKEISLCFNYTFCLIFIGEKRLRQQSKGPRTPQVTSLKLTLPQTPAQDHAHPTSWRKERWRKCATFQPHQVRFSLWKAKRQSHLAQTEHKDLLAR